MARKASKDVEQFLAEAGHPRESEIREVRAAVLACRPGVTEQVKWNAPSFCVDGDDRITFRLQPGDRVELVFHRGAKVRGDADAFTFDDPSGLLHWVASDRATVTITDQVQLDARLPELTDLAGRWMDATA